MGKQSQEQRVFDGLFNSTRGAKAPRWSAQQEINIDHQFRTIRGREPSEFAISHNPPQVGLAFDGGSKYAVLSGSSSWNLTAVTDFTVRAHVSSIDYSRIAEYANTRIFVIAEGTPVTGVTGYTVNGGWMMYLRPDGSGGVVLGVSFLNAVASNLETADITANEGPFAAEFSYNGSGYVIAAVFTGASVTNTVGSPLPIIGCRDELTIGAHRFGATDATEGHFLGVIGKVELHNSQLAVTTPWTQGDRWETYNKGDLPATVLASYAPRVGHGWSDTWADSGSADRAVALYPEPPVIDSSMLKISPGSWGVLDMEGLRVKGTNSWLLIVEFNIPAQTFPTGAPPWIVIAEDNRFFWSVNQVSATQYTVSSYVKCYDTSGDFVISAVCTTANFTFGTTYKLGLLVNPDYGTSASVDVRLYSETGGGGWALEDTDLGVLGNPQPNLKILFGTDLTRCRTFTVSISKIRLFTNLYATPDTAAKMDTLDVYPTDAGAGKTWPQGLVTSIDLAEGNYQTESSDNEYDTLSRVTSVQCDFSAKYSLQLYPTLGVCNWGATTGLTRGAKPKCHAVHPMVETIGGKTSKKLAFAMAGGVYLHDSTDDSGAWHQLDGAAGAPTGGSVAVNAKSRLIICGEGMEAVKVHPGGIASVGLGAPSVTCTDLGSSSDVGGLVESTDYKIRFSVYNSQTGQESNLSTGNLEYSTGAGHDTLNLRIDYLDVVGGSNDWDIIRVYRQDQTTGTIYYLDTEIPRPPVLPPDGPTISFLLGVQETVLVLQQTEEIDNDPPDAFTCAAMTNRTLHVGGGGETPGYAFYSKYAFTESFPPTNVWFLDGDQSNRLLAIIPLFGRILLIKQRGIWGASDNAAEVGQEPALLHSDRGLVGVGAWTVADNVVYFVSPDRVIYASDGLNLEDISSDYIRGTLYGYTEAQLAGAQVVHDARTKAIWFLIPRTSTEEGMNRDVLVFRYDYKRWSFFELPCDSLFSGFDEHLAGEYGGFAGRGNILRMADGSTNLEGDYSGSHNTWAYDLEWADADHTKITDGDGRIIGFTTEGYPFEDDLEGLPLILIPHDTVWAGGSAPTYYPVLDEDTRYYTTIEGVQTVGDVRSVYFSDPITDSSDYLYVLIGTQLRKYVSQWISPQGEDRPHLMLGTTFVAAPDVREAYTVTSFKYEFDYDPDDDTPWRYKSASPRWPDTTHKARRRMRRFRYILGGAVRTEDLEFTRVAWRYQVRGPRRRT